jgi:hypothetical protein
MFMKGFGREQASLLITMVAALLLAACSTGQRSGPTTEPVFGPVFRLHV